MGRSQLVWGLILLLLGGLMLANAMGIRLPNGMDLMDLFWPIALIMAGLWVLAGMFVRGNVETQHAVIDLQGAATASLKLSHGAGELKIHRGASGQEFANGIFAGGVEQRATRNGDRLEVRMRPVKDIFEFPFFGPRAQVDWDVALNADIPMELNLNLGADKAMIDLSDMTVTHLDLDTGASDTHLTLPARGRFRADLDLGAASMEIVVPDGLSARINASVAVGDLQVNEVRFPRTGRYYQSVDYDTAVHAVDVTLDAGAASVKIK